MTMLPPARKPRRTDPDRRSRIIDACLDVIADAGFDGTTHRRVATVADVSLGSMTYHFAGMDALLLAAFTHFAEGVAEQTERRLREAGTDGDTHAAVVDVILRGIPGVHRDLVLTHELYTLAARRPEYRVVTQTWMARIRAALEEHVDPVTARILDALIEGLTIHRALDPEPADDDVVLDAVQRILGTPDETRAG